MQGRHSGQQELFSTIDLENFIPKDHLLRKVDRLLDLDFLYGLTAALYCLDNGRPSIDPILFFRMQLVGYLYGIESDRRLCREIHLNLAYRWFVVCLWIQSYALYKVRMQTKIVGCKYLTDSVFSRLSLLQWES